MKVSEKVEYVRVCKGAHQNKILTGALCENRETVKGVSRTHQERYLSSGPHSDTGT